MANARSQTSRESKVARRRLALCGLALIAVIPALGTLFEGQLLSWVGGYVSAVAVFYWIQVSDARSERQAREPEAVEAARETGS